MSMVIERVPYSSYMAYAKKICCLPLAECYGQPFKADRWVKTYRGATVLVTSRLHGDLSNSWVSIQPIAPATGDDVASGNKQLYMINGSPYSNSAERIYVGHFIPDTAWYVSLDECKQLIETDANLNMHGTTTINWITHNGPQVRLFRDSFESEKMQLFYLDDEKRLTCFLFDDLAELSEMKCPIDRSLTSTFHHQIGLF
ncbi:hypothetical protein [Marinobacterium stanieri]|uniref:Uncharacterized protein n=1 Tax=Marinobacterium stanieri TaxID=49186 RepID=A0A1N6XK95_9GAMM|nr:hypothetical protein [Marinobacterium stanieri]SIR02806.1 hypothetical protein SAMN05421647_11475 [Marinobacterium stanieri]